MSWSRNGFPTVQVPKSNYPGGRTGCQPHTVWTECRDIKWAGCLQRVGFLAGRKIDNGDFPIIMRDCEEFAVRRPDVYFANRNIQGIFVFHPSIPCVQELDEAGLVACYD